MKLWKQAFLSSFFWEGSKICITTLLEISSALYFAINFVTIYLKLVLKNQRFSYNFKELGNGRSIIFKQFDTKKLNSYWLIHTTFRHFIKKLRNFIYQFLKIEKLLYYKIYFQNLSVAKNFESILCYIFSLTAELFSVANI